MSWFSKNKETPEIKQNTLLDFFSTDYALNSQKRSQSEVLALTFQKGIDSLKIAGANGTMDSSCALDNEYPDLTQAKITNLRGIGIPDAQISWYAQQGFIGWQTCAMLSQNWLIDKACTLPAKDAIRNGYEITINDGTAVDPKVLQVIRKWDKKFKLKSNCVEFVRNGKIFGIRIALFLVDSKDVEYYEKPFNIDGVMPGSYRGITQIDPYWLAPLLDMSAAANPAAKDFYEPTWWIVNGQKVHKSHLIIYRTCEVPDILKPTYMYGGIPLTQQIAERVYAAERTANEAPMLAMTKRLNTFKLDSTKALANQEALQQHLTYLTELRNNYGVQVIGLDEEIQQFDTSLTDLDAIIMTQYQIVAAIARVPATKLLGTSPKGFNATGEFEESSYHEELESIQENDMSPLIERHHLLLIKSIIAPKFGKEVFDIEINWNPCDSPTAAEIAEINLKKSQTDSAYVNVGALDGVDVRNRLIADKDSGYNGIETVTETLGDNEEIESDENA